MSTVEEFFQVLQLPDRSGRPKYQRLADTLVDAIRQGLWRPGDRLPPEEELTQLTPFSLGTVQRALRDPAVEVLTWNEAKARFERAYLVNLLKMTEGRVADAARLADRNRTEFYRLLQKHDLTPALFRGAGEDAAD